MFAGLRRWVANARCRPTVFRRRGDDGGRVVLSAIALAIGLTLSGTAGAAGVVSPASSGNPTGFRFEIVTADDSGVTRRIADDLYKQLVPIFGGFRTELAQHRRMVYVAIGPVALRNVAARKCDCVVIAAFTSSQVWRSVTEELQPARVLSMTAIYAEPAPVDQLRLIELLYKRPVRVAAIVSSNTGFLKPTLQGIAEIEHYDPSEDINVVLNRIGKTEVLLAMPDRSVYNTENVRNILLSTYRHNQAVIGFSADMVMAGALATTYSTIEQINAQVADVANEFVVTGELAPPQFPRYFSTVINEGVARSLDVAVDDAARNFTRRPPVRRQ
ncbi:hypothetical protein [Massilia violaceinigra]|uniref:hypothetical protein n=1 Tax=Massilia violaceinigra TaxID=2045208 RepID=UPI001E4251FD|nr:hypothetical protein [Massilia violaceinigra]